MKNIQAHRQTIYAVMIEGETHTEHVNSYQTGLLQVLGRTDFSYIDENSSTLNKKSMKNVDYRY